jgi:hypothetical protein
VRNCKLHLSIDAGKSVPTDEAIVSKWISPIQPVELSFMLWLLIMVADPKQNPVGKYRC